MIENRIKLYDILTSYNVKETIEENLKYILSIIPEIKYMINFPHKHPHHQYDVWNHTLHALSLSENNFDIRLCLLLHDLGKPFSYIEENNIRHYPNHPKVSSIMSKDILERLGYKKEYIDEICKLIELHDTKITEDNISNNYNFYYKLYQIQYCDALAHNKDKLEKRIEYLNNTKSLIKKYTRI